MKGLRSYLLTAAALCAVLLGAVMPLGAAGAQDARVDGLRKSAGLDPVALTLRQEGDVETVLRLMTQDYTENVWEKETVLSREEAQGAALDVLEELDRYGLLPKGELAQFQKTAGKAESHLLVAEDGSSALIWACTWDGDYGTYITLDDATGKAVRVLVNNTRPAAVAEKDASGQTALCSRWSAFLGDYYGVEPPKVREGLGGAGASCALRFSAKDGGDSYELPLEIGKGYTFFNYR